MNTWDRHWFTLDGVSCMDFGVYISGKNTFGAPKKKNTIVSVPGRNGDLIMDDNEDAETYENIEVSYDSFILDDNFEKKLDAFRDFLLSTKGYVRLEDNYHPEEYRLANYSNNFEPELLDNLSAGSFEVIFNCKPQRFLKSGEKVLTYTSTGNILNPTRHKAKPLVRVYGTGTFYLSGIPIRVLSNSSYIDIDCDVMEAYTGATSKNNVIQLANGKFPYIDAGLTGVDLGTGITKLEITPRWWTV